MATQRFGNFVFYFVTDEIRYPHPPSEVCAAARSTLRGLVGLSDAGYDILFDMMTEINGMVNGGCDRWVGFSAAAFNKEKLETIRELVRREFLIKQIVPSEDGHDTTVIYFLSPGVIA